MREKSGGRSTEASAWLGGGRLPCGAHGKEDPGENLSPGERSQQGAHGRAARAQGQATLVSCAGNALTDRGRGRAYCHPHSGGWGRGREAKVMCKGGARGRVRTGTRARRCRPEPRPIC